MTPVRTPPVVRAQAGVAGSPDAAGTPARLLHSCPNGQAMRIPGLTFVDSAEPAVDAIPGAWHPRG